MRKGLLRYDAKNKRTKNIGDYVQSIAAKQFLGEEVFLVEREHLHKYEGEELLLIMNAWWMHYGENWPPSPDIKPLNISMHISPGVAENMLSEKGIEYFKKHQPIGCRDLGTKRLLEAKGIEAYFSACLTLTLGQTYQNNPKGRNICFVDPYYNRAFKLRNPLEFLKRAFLLMKDYKVISKINARMRREKSLKSLLKLTEFYKTYSTLFTDDLLINAKYINHSVLENKFKNEQEKFAYADELLKTYSESQLVVTSRIHAALPSLAMNTPQIFVNSDFFEEKSDKGRFEGLIDFLNVVECSNSSLKPWNFAWDKKKKIGLKTRIKNQETFKPYAEKLIKTCMNFLKENNK